MLTKELGWLGYPMCKSSVQIQQRAWTVTACRRLLNATLSSLCRLGLLFWLVWYIFCRVSVTLQVLRNLKGWATLSKIAPKSEFSGNFNTLAVDTAPDAPGSSQALLGLPISQHRSIRHSHWLHSVPILTHKFACYSQVREVIISTLMTTVRTLEWVSNHQTLLTPTSPGLLVNFWGRRMLSLYYSSFIHSTKCIKHLPSCSRYCTKFVGHQDEEVSAHTYQALTVQWDRSITNQMTISEC